MRSRPARSPRGLALAYFAAVASLATGWAIATPVMGAPDEPDHVRRAAGIVRGQLIGDYVKIPESLGVLGACVFGDFPPECPAMRARGSDDVSVEVPSRLNRNSPFYYAIVGLPTLVEPGHSTVYVMRFVSALLVAGALALAAFALLHLDTPRWAIIGLAVAVTPMVLFLAGSVNPSGLEIAAGVGLWATLLVWFRGRRSAERSVPWLVRAGLLAAVLLVTRALGPMFLALILAGAALAAPPGSVRALWKRSTSLKVAVWVGVGVAAASVVWTSLAGTLGVGPPENVRRFVWDVVNALAAYQRQMIGVFGWLDTPAQDHVYTTWLAVLGLLFFGAMAVGPNRIRILLVLLVISIVIVPLATQIAGGLIWQGRYLLPLIVGLPLAAGVALAGSSTWGAALSSPWALWSVLIPLGVCQITSFWWALHRNVIGLSEAWIGFEPLWQPPLGWIPLTVLYAIGVAGYLVVLAALAEGTSATTVSAEPTR